jgi:8-oxo-dGTP pyrophosphatase MutT (NUDIX family)
MDESLMDRIPNQEMHRVATTAIIFRPDGRVLIIQRAHDKIVWPGKWTLPGGGIETNDYTTRTPTHTGSTNQWYDTLDHSLRREVREETGLEISDPWLVCDLTFIRPDGIPVLVLSYAADLRGDSRVILDQKESSAYAWINLDDIRVFDLIDGIEHELRLAYVRWPGDKFTDEMDRNARAYGYEVGRGRPIAAEILSLSKDNPFLDRDWKQLIKTPEEK